MFVVDTGPIIALLDVGDPHHAACGQALNELPFSPLWTTWPCFTEAMHLLNRLGGHPLRELLWSLRVADRLELIDLTRHETDHMAILMRQYVDVPMDLADASLVAVESSRKVDQLLTIDSDFYIYRLQDPAVVRVLR